ncbi:hypothetical protein TNCV_533091 [Trichonephila clavipes]|nr:hypothetical protein TNCV_533091 [Trichonephila clavipes]
MERSINDRSRVILHSDVLSGEGTKEAVKTRSKESGKISSEKAGRIEFTSLCCEKKNSTPPLSSKIKANAGEKQLNSSVGTKQLNSTGSRNNSTGETTQLGGGNEQLNSPVGTETTQLVSRAKQLNSAAGAEQLNSPAGTKQLNSSVGTKQLNSALPSTT